MQCHIKPMNKQSLSTTVQMGGVFFVQCSRHNFIKEENGNNQMSSEISG